MSPYDLHLPEVSDSCMLYPIHWRCGPPAPGKSSLQCGMHVKTTSIHRPVARSGKGGGFENNKCGPKVGVDHQKGVGAGGGCAPSGAKRGSF